MVKTIEEIEQQVNKTNHATSKALGKTERAKEMGDVTKAKILKLIKDITDYLAKKFNHPKVRCFKKFLRENFFKPYQY